MIEPVFSVIIPVYNKGPHIKRALGSVIGQDFSALEIIVVNDASTDGSEKILEQFNDARIRIFQRTEPGLGGYAARNLGIEKARGQWITFLDADDEWLPGHLSRLFELSEIFPMAEILGCGWYISDGSSCIINPYASRCKKKTLFDPEKYLDVQGRGMDLLHTDVVAVKRYLIEAIGGFPVAGPSCKRAGDGQTWLRCILAGAELAWRPEPGAVYYQDAVNMVTRAKQYDLNENCLINFLNGIIREGGDRSDGIMRGLKRYRDSRILSHLLQHARTGKVTREHVVHGLRYFRLDVRFLLIFIAWLFPWAGEKLFKLKDRFGGVQSR